jgi:hypothetical protein
VRGQVLARCGNGPTEVINGRLEYLSGFSLGFRKPHQLHHPVPTRGQRLQTYLHRRCKELIAADIIAAVDNEKGG